MFPKILSKKWGCMPKKKKGKLCLLLCVFVAFVTLSPSGQYPRRLKCLKLNERDGTDVHRAMYEEEGPCITEYPDDAPEIVLDPEDKRVLEDPVFDVVPETDDDAVLPPPSDADDDQYILAPDNDGDKVIDVAEVDLLDSYEPKIYDPEIAIAEWVPDDSSSIGYFVVDTECPVLEEPSPSPDTPPDDDDYHENNLFPPEEMYEVCAILKHQVCDVTEKAEEARKLGKTSKLRQLVALDQLSAAEMNYTM